MNLQKQNIYVQVAGAEINNRLQKFLPQPLAVAIAGIDVDEDADALEFDDTCSQTLSMMAFIEQRVTEMVQFYQGWVTYCKKSYFCITLHKSHVFLNLIFWWISKTAYMNSFGSTTKRFAHPTGIFFVGL